MKKEFRAHKTAENPLHIVRFVGLFIGMAWRGDEGIAGRTLRAATDLDNYRSGS